MLRSGFFFVQRFATSASSRVHAALATDTAGLEGPAVPLIEPSRRHEGGDGRQTDLRACFCIETAKVVTTCPTSR